jgi:hypothetical protein
MKTPEELVEDIFAQDKELRLMALTYIVQNIEPHGDRKTLRTLQACFLAGYQAAARQWISVKDRLPEKDHTVLIYTREHEIYMAKIYENNEAWPISNSCGCCGREEKFTHWMPLPEAPKEES